MVVLVGWSGGLGRVSRYLIRCSLTYEQENPRPVSPERERHTRSCHVARPLSPEHASVHMGAVCSASFDGLLWLPSGYVGHFVVGLLGLAGT